MDVLDQIWLNWETANIIVTTALLMIGFGGLAMMRLLLP